MGWRDEAVRLMRRYLGISHPNDMVAVPLKFKAYRKYTKRDWGKAMTTQAVQDTRYPISKYARRMQDVFLVSSFGLWAVLLGLSPVLAFRLLMGS
jgi:hypothetical protein